MPAPNSRIRLAVLTAIRKRMAHHEREEVKRIKQQWRKHRKLESWEAQILAAAAAPRRVGAPVRLEWVHKLVAVHVLWLRAQGHRRNVPKKVASLWNLSRKSVDKCVRAHRQAAQVQVTEWSAKHAAEPELYPAWAFQQRLESMADGFARLGLDTN